MRVHALVLLTLAAASAAEAQSSASAVELRAVAIRSVHAAEPASSIVVVNAARDNPAIGRDVAARLGARLISATENAECGGEPGPPKCGWRLGDDMLAVRVRVDSDRAASAVTTVETWGTYWSSVSNRRVGVLEVWRIEFERRGVAWVVTKRHQISGT